MKIAFISRWFVEENKRTGGRGGSEQQRVRGYIQAGHKVVVLSQAEDSRRLEVRDINGITVVTTPRWKRVWWLALLDKAAKRWTEHRKVFSDAWELQLFLERFGPFEVLEAQCEEPDGLVVAVCSKFWPVPKWCIQLFALRYSFEGTEPRFEQKHSLGFAFRRADIVKANSELVADILEREYGCPKGKIVVVHPNVDLQVELGTEETKQRRDVLCVGALTKTKGIETFVKCVELLRGNGMDYDFEVVGGIGSEAQYARELMSVGKRVGIVLAGEVKKDELLAKMRRADVVVIPSWFDAWNRAAIEAIGQGRPVVISDRCGAAEWIAKQRAGIVVRAGDASQLADGIRSALEEARYREAASSAAVAARVEFGIERIVQRNLEVLTELTQGRGHARWKEQSSNA